MGEFPATHTTTSVTATNTTVQTNLRFDSLYIRTIPGLIKVVRIVTDLLGFICINVSLYSLHSRGSFFDFVAMVGFWFSLIMLGLYLFHFVEKFYKLPWLKIEMIFCGVWAILYLIAASLAADFCANFQASAYGAASFFGFISMVCYGVDAYLKFVNDREGKLAQGERVVSKTINTVSA